MDTKVLFHNPSTLTDGELKQMQRKLNLQRVCPLWMTAFAGMSSAAFDATILKKATCYKRFAFFAGAGYVMGCMAADTMGESLTHRHWDSDILQAFEKRWVGRAMAASGFGGNWVHQSHSQKHPAIKPY